MNGILASLGERLDRRRRERADVRPAFPTKDRQWLGFLGILALIAVIDRFSTHVVYLPFAGLIYLAAVVYVACWSGLRSALAGCALLVVYAWIVYHFPISAFGRQTAKANQAIISTAIVYTLVAVIAALVQDRLRKAAIREFDARSIAGAESRQRKLAEAELWASEEMRKRIVNSSLDAVIAMSGDGTITMWNPNAEKLFGWTRAESIGRRFGERVHTPELEPGGAELRSLIESTDGAILRAPFEVVAQNKSGEPVSIELYMAECKAETESVFIAFARDITERKSAELAIRDLNARLEERVTERTAQLEKANSELVGFTYSVSHDLRAPLRSIVANSRIVREDCEDYVDVNSRQRLKRLEESAVQMGQLIDDLLQFARIGQVALHLQEVDLSSMVSTVVGDLKSTKDGSATVQEGMIVQADPEMIRMVVINLLENAWKYTHPGHEPAVEVGTTPDQAFFFRDRGIGFDMRYVDKIWEPFERLHRPCDYPGTGIGLANCRRIIARHGGRIWAESKPGEGATFYFKLGTECARSASQDRPPTCVLRPASLL